MSDIITMVWKEWKELFYQHSFWSKFLNFLIYFGVLGIFFPYMIGPMLFNSILILPVMLFTMVGIVGGVVPSSFAGEREKHTLETLLASRLSDQTILIGKLVASVGYGLIVTFFILVLWFITSNIVYGKEGSIIPSLTFFLGLGLSLMFSVFTANIGVFVSLRTATTLAAQQLMASIFMFFMMASIFMPRIFSTSWEKICGDTSINKIIVVMTAVLFILNLCLTFMVMARFRRASLLIKL